MLVYIILKILYIKIQTRHYVLIMVFLHFFSFIYVAGVFGVRHLQTFLMFLGLTLAYALRVNMSVAIVAMTDRHAANPDYEVYIAVYGKRLNVLNIYGLHFF